MCGIVGGTRVAPDSLQRACATIRHRGPDAEGCWRHSDDLVAFGHRRLSILDLDSRADQPMHCPATGNVVVFNGELYNFRALRQELERTGVRFRTTSDTEVLLAAYALWGTAAVERFNGMFAFALYDARRHRLVFARDRVGKKPLYLAVHDGELTFASELKALFAARPTLPRSLDTGALRAYMDLGYVPGELCIYAGVRKLPPAHTAEFCLVERQLRMERYWELPPPGEDDADEDAAADELESLLQDAIRLRLESDVPVGAFLSGGLDSSLVAALAAPLAPELVLYTARFEERAFDETPMAARVAGALGLRHVILDVRPPDLGLMARLGRQFDEPFADSSLIPTYLVSEAISRHTKVALSGDGGDELFAGYDSYRRALALAARTRVPSALRRAAALAHHLLPVGVPGKNYLRHLPFDGVELFRRIGAEPESEAVSPLRPAVERALATQPRDGFRGQVLARLARTSSGADALRRMTELDFVSYLPDDILVKVDRASMLASLEVRAPLLDYRIAEFAFRLPSTLRIRGGRQKYLLKRIAARRLPADFPLDRKQGFAIPAAQWFRSEWGDALLDLIPADDALLDRERVARLLARHRRNGREAPLLFKTLMLAYFRQAERGGGGLDTPRSEAAAAAL